MNQEKKLWLCDTVDVGDALARSAHDPALFEQVLDYIRHVNRRACRSFAPGQRVRIEERSTDFACVRSADRRDVHDDERHCFWLRPEWITKVEPRPGDDLGPPEPTLADFD